MDARRKQLRTPLEALDAPCIDRGQLAERRSPRISGTRRSSGRKRRSLRILVFAGQQRIRMIHAALKRIEDGTYGICVNCGDDIAAEPIWTSCRTPRVAGTARVNVLISRSLAASRRAEFPGEHGAFDAEHRMITRQARPLCERRDGQGMTQLIGLRPIAVPTARAAWMPIRRRNTGNRSRRGLKGSRTSASQTFSWIGAPDEMDRRGGEITVRAESGERLRSRAAPVPRRNRRGASARSCRPSRAPSRRSRRSRCRNAFGGPHDDGRSERAVEPAPEDPRPAPPRAYSPGLHRLPAQEEQVVRPARRRTGRCHGRRRGRCGAGQSVAVVEGEILLEAFGADAGPLAEDPLEVRRAQGQRLPHISSKNTAVQGSATSPSMAAITPKWKAYASDTERFLLSFPRKCSGVRGRPPCASHPTTRR